MYFRELLYFRNAYVKQIWYPRVCIDCVSLRPKQLSSKCNLLSFISLSITDLIHLHCSMKSWGIEWYAIWKENTSSSVIQYFINCPCYDWWTICTHVYLNEIVCGANGSAHRFVDLNWRTLIWRAPFTYLNMRSLQWNIFEYHPSLSIKLTH